MFFKTLGSKLVVSFILILILCSFLFSCESNKESEIKYFYDKETIPTMRTSDDTMYISDSGRIRFKVIAKTMMVFDKSKTPYTLFPDSAYLEQYDSLMNITTTVRADSVWYYDKKKLWKLRGNVDILNAEGTSYKSEELYFDEPADKAYSDLNVFIKEPNRLTLRAKGFVSNLNMTEFTYRTAEDGEIYVSESNNTETKNDSIK